jgi:hypothetical protein
MRLPTPDNTAALRAGAPGTRCATEPVASARGTRKAASALRVESGFGVRLWRTAADPIGAA